MMETMNKRANYLSVVESFNLDHAAKALVPAFGHCTYQVGSSLQRPNFRDVDLRCMLDDDEFDTIFGRNKARLMLLNTAISEWLAARTGLPVDFQFQRTTDANKEFAKQPRSATGLMFLYDPIPGEPDGNDE